MAGPRADQRGGLASQAVTGEEPPGQAGLPGLVNGPVSVQRPSAEASSFFVIVERPLMFFFLASL